MMKKLALSMLLGASLGCASIYSEVMSPRPERLRSRKDFHWIEEPSANGRFTFLVEEGAEPASDRALREATLERSIARSFAFIQEPDQGGEHLTYAVVRSPDRLKALIGVQLGPGSAMSFPRTNLICGDPGTWRQVHEVFHWVSIRTWGESATWMKEGLAVAADGQWFGYDLDAVALHIQKEGHLVPLADLLRRFRAFDSLITYPEAGSLLKFIRDTYGVAQVKAIWKKGGSHIPDILGVDLPTLEKRWLARVAQADDRDMDYKVRSES